MNQISKSRRSEVAGDTRLHRLHAPRLEGRDGYSLGGELTHANGPMTVHRCAPNVAR
jgi:hypothetical protein